MAIQSNLIVFLFFGLAGLLLLGLIIFLAFYFSKSDKKKVASDRTRPLVELTDPDVIVEGEQQNPGKPEATRLVSFGRMHQDDRFAVRFEGEWISQPSQLSLIQRDRLTKNIKEAVEWLGTENTQVKEEPSSRSTYSESLVPPLVSEKVVEKHKRQMSIVEQVDDVLQDLLTSSSFSEKNIRLTESPNKGVIVWVGNEYYEGINAVPDEEVKRIIRQAVKKWEDMAGS